MFSFVSSTFLLHQSQLSVLDNQCKVVSGIIEKNIDFFCAYRGSFHVWSLTLHKNL
jgi:hypothetical protein